MAQPAGWYSDPSGLPARRWWDGKQWTDQIQPGGAPIPPPNGFFPPVPPTGPPVPSYASTSTATSASAGAVRENTTALRSEPPGPPPPHPEVPAAPFTMPPVDAPPASPSASPSVVPSSEDGLTRQQRTAGFIGLALIAVLVLALTAIILLA
ncbi:DUF2510 domain-containing protein [Actinoplanes couchii]|uniref:DUF2510 domain-containing protein n=1 Tax=Actinoplanes couchii TaxID=403638 RepID=A0ABQ3XMF2_9ACTN|nr:DUF2510 domain-containing protein [Actinoplanes couchii]MDR6321579.1 hypothetical protein [Actinoplanes couchii]GID59676.1 hypothetical protein Aco03nite_080800 [Actinoplanes couchii]